MGGVCRWRSEAFVVSVVAAGRGAGEAAGEAINESMANCGVLVASSEFWAAWEGGPKQ